MASFISQVTTCIFIIRPRVPFLANPSRHADISTWIPTCSTWIPPLCRWVNADLDTGENCQNRSKRFKSLTLTPLTHPQHRQMQQQMMQQQQQQQMFNPLPPVMTPTHGIPPRPGAGGPPSGMGFGGAGNVRGRGRMPSAAWLQDPMHTILEEEKERKREMKLLKNREAARLNFWKEMGESNTFGFFCSVDRIHGILWVSLAAVSPNSLANPPLPCPSRYQGGT